MEKWLLLLLSGLSIWFNFQFAQWLGLVRTISEGESEKLFGLNGGKELPPSNRGTGSRFVIIQGQSFLFVLFICSIASSVFLVTNTYRALFP